jgi:hypothetical protein
MDNEVNNRFPSYVECSRQPANAPTIPTTFKEAPDMAHLQRSVLLLGLLGLLRLIGPTVFAQYTVTGQKSPLTGTTTISGRVLLNGAPAAGIKVLLFRNDISWMSGIDSRGGVVAETVTDGNGNYRIQGVLAGGYKVLPFNPALVFTPESLGRFGPGKYVFAGDGESIDRIDFSLVRAAVISGRVTLAGGQPAVGARVSISTADHGVMLFDPATGAPRQSETTDDNGAFRIYGLAPDRYRIRVLGYGAGSSGWRPAVYYPGVRSQSRAVAISLSAGEEVTSADIALGAPERTYEIAGQILGDSGKPIANAGYFVSAVSETGAFVGGHSFRGRADGSGQFRVQGLLPGNQSFSVVPDGRSAYSSGDPAIIRIQDANVTRLRIHAHGAASASGFVVIEGTADPRILAQLSTLRIDVISGGGKIPDLPARLLDLAPDGTFKVAGLMAGRLSFILNTRTGEENFSILRVDCDGDPKKQTINISDGEQFTGLRVVLAYGAAVIRGQVVGFQGGMLADATSVQVSARLISGDSPAFERFGQADARGRFEIRGLIDGQYKIAAGPAQQQTITVANGQAPEITVTLDLNKRQ